MAKVDFTWSVHVFGDFHAIMDEQEEIVLIVDELAGQSVRINAQLHVVHLSGTIGQRNQRIVDTCIEFCLVHLRSRKFLQIILTIEKDI